MKNSGKNNQFINADEDALEEEDLDEDLDGEELPPAGENEESDESEEESY